MRRASARPNGPSVQRAIGFQPNALADHFLDLRQARAPVLIEERGGLRAHVHRQLIARDAAAARAMARDASMATVSSESTIPTPSHGSQVTVMISRGPSEMF